MKKVEKPLFSVESELSFEEYKKIVKHFPRVYWSFVISNFLLFMVIISILEVALNCSIDIVIVSMIFTLVGVLLINIVCYDHKVQKLYEKIIYYNDMDEYYKIDFYKSYLVKLGKYNQVKLDYKKIDNVFEFDSNFCLLTQFGFIYIEKKYCNEQLIKFIKDCIDFEMIGSIR